MGIANLMKSKEQSGEKRMLPIEIMVHICEHITDFQTIVALSRASVLFRSIVHQKLKLFEKFREEANKFVLNQLAYDELEWKYINTQMVVNEVQKIFQDVVEFYLKNGSFSDKMCLKLSDLYFETHLGSSLCIDRFETDYNDCKNYCALFNSLISNCQIQSIDDI
jgi:hypothetical protein